MGNIKGITIEIGGNTTKLDQALKSVNKTTRDLESELKQVNKALKLDPGNMTLLQQKQKLLSQEVENTKTKLETLKEAEKQAENQFKNGKIGEEKYRALQREVIKTENELKGLQTQLNNTNPKLDSLAASADKVSNTANTVSSKTKAVSAAITGIGVACASASISAEDSMAKLWSLADHTAISYNDLKQGVMDLSNQTGISFNEIAEQSYQAISAGSDTANALDVVKANAILAKTGFTDLANAMDLSTTVMNAYKMDAYELSHISDVLNITQDKGKTSVDQLSQSMGNVIPTASMYHVKLEQLSSGYAALTKNGIETSQAGTSLNSMFAELGSNGSKASDILKNKTSKSFTELMDSGSRLTDVLKIIDDEAKKSGLSIGDIFSNKNAIKGAASLTQNAKDFDDTLKAMNDSAGITDSKLEDLQTTGSSFKKGLNELKNVGIQLGDVLSPVLQSIARVIKNIADALSNLSPTTRSVIVYIGLFIAAISPVAKIVTLLSTSFSLCVKAFKTFSLACNVAKGAATTASLGIKLLAGAISFLTSPIGIVVMVITALVGAFIYLWNNCEAFRNFWISIWENIKEVTQNAVDIIVNFFTIIIPKSWNTLTYFFAGIPNWFNELLDSIINNIVSIWQGIKDFFVTMWDGIVNVFDAAILLISDFLNSKFGNTIEGVKTVFEGLQSFFMGIWDTIRNTFLIAILLICDLVTLNFDKLKEDAHKSLGKLLNSVKEIWEGITLIFSGYLQTIYGYVVDIFTNIYEGIKIIWNSVCSFLKDIWNIISTDISAAWQSFKDIIYNSCSYIYESVKLKFEEIKNSISYIIDNFPEMARNAFNNMVNAIGNALSSVGSVIYNGFSSGIEFLKSLPSQAITWGRDFIDGLVSGIKSKIRSVKDAVVGVADTIRSYLHFSVPDIGPLTDYETWMPDFMEGLANGINKSKSIVTNAISGLANNMTTELKYSPKLMGISQSLPYNNVNLNSEPINIIVNVDNNLNGKQLEDTLTTKVTKKISKMQNSRNISKGWK